MDGDNFPTLMSGFITILVGQWITYVVAMLSTAYITRALGPVDYAKFIQMQFIVSIFVTIFNLSIPSAVSRYVAEHAAKGEMYRASGALKTGLKITIVTGMVASITMILLSDQLARAIVGDAQAAELVKLLAVSAGLSVAISPLASYIYALQKFREWTLISVLSFAFWRGGLVVALLLGTGLFGLSFAWAVISVVSSLVLAISILPKAGRAEAYPLSQLFSYSIPLIASTLLGFTSQWIDSLLIPYVGSMSMLSIVNIAGSLTNISLVLINTASTVLFTHFVRVDAIDGMEATIEAGQRISRLLSYCFVPLGFLVGATSDLLVLLYAGEAFTQAAFLLKVLAPFMTTGAILLTIWSNEVTATGKTRLLLLNTIMTLVSYPVLGILLVPKLGEVGYLLTRIVCGIIAFPYVWMKTKVLIPVRFDFRALLISALVSAVIIVPATLVETLTLNYLLTSITSVLGFVCYTFIIINFGLLTREEARLILILIVQSIKFKGTSKRLDSLKANQLKKVIFER
ncbi:MAG: oligosaccharide flippase family protein [Thermoproteota archaeon]